MYSEKRFEVNEPGVVEPVKPLEQWRQDLLAAAQYIRVHGWCQQLTRNSRGEVCMLGGVYYSIPSSSGASGCLHKKQLGFRLETASRHMEPHLKGPVSWWNDAPGRTKEEVIAKLEEIARAR